MQFEWTGARTSAHLTSAKRLPVLQAALAKTPNRADIRAALANALFDCDRLPEVVALFPRLDACDACAAFHVGRAASLMKDFDRALPALRLAARQGVPGAWSNLARACESAELFDEALSAAEASLESDPSNFVAFRTLTDLLLRKGDARRLLDRCCTLWEQGVRTGLVVTARARALFALGRREEAARLCAPEPWFASRDLDLGGDFPARLADEILAAPALQPGLSYKPTRGNTKKLDDFDAVKSPSAQKLMSAFKTEISNYFDSRSAYSGHPLIAGWPEKARGESWALNMVGDGYEEWHVHTNAWLSGVYYARVPALPEGGNPNAGHVEFGPAEKYGGDFGMPSWSLAPRQGLLLIFPGYFPHRTWPTGVDGARICVAFNVIAE